MKKRANTFILITAIVFGQGAVAGAGIVTSKHNLSAITGTGDIKATEESEVCIFCHTPHNANASKDIYYLWNREDPIEQYTPYTSSTMKAPEGALGSLNQPTGASRLCLSCHDGTIASKMGAVLSRPYISFFGGVDTLIGRSSSLGTDLSDDHPVSFNYKGSITSGNTELFPAEDLIGSVKLDSSGQLQCTACHDPHDDTKGKFLVMSNVGSALCRECHDKTGWSKNNNTHATSDAIWSGTTTVAENGCSNCHRPHNAGRHERLLKEFNEEDTCLACHSGQVATESNIKTELDKKTSLFVSTHPVASYISTHDAAEDFSTTVTNHVECEDCHNPHQVNSDTADAPFVSGKNSGVQGIDKAGVINPDADYLYEICFKCHAADSNNVIEDPEITRQFDIPLTRLDTREEFNYINNGLSSSSHPVIQTTSSPYTPSLRISYQTSNIYCTDCHGSNDPDNGAQGPHGSTYKHLLVARYETQDGAGSSYSRDFSDLCYKCHDPDIVEGGDLSEPGGFAKIFSHGGHLAVSGNNEVVSCATCHDPHGSSKYPDLINFHIGTAPNTVTSFTSYVPGDSETSPTCVLKCHGKEHKDPDGSSGGGGR